MKSPSRIASSKKVNKVTRHVKKATPKELPIEPTPVRDQLVDVVRHAHAAGHGLLAGTRVLIDLDSALGQAELAQTYLKTFDGMDVGFVAELDLGCFPFEPLRTAGSKVCDATEREIDSWGIDDGPGALVAEVLDARCQALAKALDAERRQREISRAIRSKYLEVAP